MRCFLQTVHANPRYEMNLINLSMTLSPLNIYYMRRLHALITKDKYATYIIRVVYITV